MSQPTQPAAAANGGVSQPQPQPQQQHPAGTGETVWKDGKVVAPSAHLTQRKEKTTNKPQQDAAATATSSASNNTTGAKKVAVTSPRLLAPAPVPHDDNLPERHPLTKTRQDEVNEHLYYGPMKAITSRVADLDKKYLSPTKDANATKSAIPDDEIAVRMYVTPLEARKKAKEALMAKYVTNNESGSGGGSKVLSAEEGTLVIQRVYNSAIDKRNETYQSLLDKYVPKREYAKLSKEQIKASAARLSTSAKK
eukprot:PhF_6_TR38042/c0_g1_i2/m.56767